MTRGPFDRLAIAASLVFIADFSSKQWALRALTGEGEQPLHAGWHLAVVNNTHLAGGVESGGLELPVTAVLTTLVVFLVLRVCRQLASIDHGAPAILGMLVGSGAANLADSLIPPRGVVDFIGFTARGGGTMSFNVADVVLVAALGLFARIIWRLTQTMRGKVRPRLTPLVFAGARSMRDRLLLAAGHALLAMCGFIWLYSMAIALTPDAGRSAPSSLLCGVAVFAITFVASEARLRVAQQRAVSRVRSFDSQLLERVVGDGSISPLPLADTPTRRRDLPVDVVSRDEPRPQRGDIA